MILEMAKIKIKTQLMAQLKLAFKIFETKAFEIFQKIVMLRIICTSFFVLDWPNHLISYMFSFFCSKLMFKIVFSFRLSQGGVAKFGS